MFDNQESIFESETKLKFYSKTDTGNKKNHSVLFKMMYNVYCTLRAVLYNHTKFAPDRLKP